MMKRITTPLLILGCVLVFAGIAVETLGFGNRYPADCPAQYRTPGGCLHSFSNSISLFGVNIYRTTVGNSAIIVGTILIVTAQWRYCSGKKAQGQDVTLPGLVIAN